MKDALICEPVRTAVGRYGGMYLDVPATELARTVIEAVLQRTNIDPALIERRHLRSVLSQWRSAGDRSRCGAGRRHSGDCARPSARPPVWFGIAGRARRGHARADRGLQAGDGGVESVEPG